MNRKPDYIFAPLGIAADTAALHAGFASHRYTLCSTLKNTEYYSAGGMYLSGEIYDFLLSRLRP